MVYVDDMYLYPMGRFGRLKCSHMAASTDSELHAMAATIGVSRSHWQSPAKTWGSHYDIAISKRAMAINAGAIPVTMKQLAAMNARRRETGELGDPETAIAWLHAHWRARHSAPDTTHHNDLVTRDGTKNSSAVLPPNAIGNALRPEQGTLFPEDDENPAS